MRNSPFLWAGVVSALFVAACGQPTAPTEDTYTFSALYGTWVWAGYGEENVVILKRSSELDDSLYGLIIRPHGPVILTRGELTERKSAGWCGTPPTTYADYEGEWKALSENLLEIAVGYWGGTTSYQMEIVSLSSDELKIVRRHVD